MEHTADLRIRAWGRSFQGTLLDLSNYVMDMIYGRDILPDVFLSSSLEYESNDSCVVRLLNDLIYESERRGLAIRVKKITICEGSIRWEATGEKADRRKRGSILVKAATYDRIKVSRVPPMVEVTLDI